MIVLDLPMSENDARAATIRDYLKALVETLWKQGEGFSGKRPFGNSGWRYEIYRALVEGGAVKGTFDEDGNLDDIDDMAAFKLVLEAIHKL